MWRCGVLLLLLCSVVLASMAGVRSSETASLWGNPGFITINTTANASVFYWFFENQHPDAPIVLWLSGGPGCSGELALLMENGPFMPNANLSLRTNPYSWTNVAHILYVDQPFGVGFSTAKDEYIHDEAQVGAEMLTFMNGFYDSFERMRMSPLFIFAESYGGHYGPAVATALLNSNASIPLKGLALGDPWVDPVTQFGTTAPYAFDRGLINASVLAELQTQYQVCLGDLSAKNYTAADNSCGGIIVQIMLINPTLNPEYIPTPCVPRWICYNFSLLEDYLNQQSVRAWLNVESAPQWQACNMSLQNVFQTDYYSNTAPLVGALLDAGVPVLVYTGLEDLVCDAYGAGNWTAKMTWHGQSSYNEQTLQPWGASGSTLGYLKQSGPLSFLLLENAGHMAPHDAPAATEYMLAQFVFGHLKPGTDTN